MSLVMRELSGRILVVAEEIAVMRAIAGATMGRRSYQIEWVPGATEAIDLLRRSTNDIVLVLADKHQKDGTPFDVFEFVRRNPDCPYPGTSLALTGETITEVDVRRSALLGCLHFLGRPFQVETVVHGLSQWPMDRTDFIVSGSYTGPDRRRSSRQEMVERRTISGPAEQTIASTGLAFDIKASTTVFRFRRLPADDADPALALRNGLTRETVSAARAHVRVKQDQALAMLGHTFQRIMAAYEELLAKPGRPEMALLNAVAREAGALTETRGLQLVGTITRGLVGYTGDGNTPNRGLLDLLRAHLDALKSALANEIVDDGGAVGRPILATLRAAEDAFKDAKAAMPEGAPPTPH